jgi:Cu/Ag efflux protein CusF
MMNGRLCVFVMGVCLAALAGCSTERQPDPGISTASTTTEGKDSVQDTNVVQVTATVEAIDQKTRMVTLRGPEGKLITFKAGEDVRNLAQVKKGDQVVATYYESVALRVRKPGEVEPGVEAAEATDRAKVGEKPGAASAQTVTVTTTVEKIDRKKETITLKGPEGKLTTVKVREPKRLDKVAVGDRLQITYTEAVAISVEKP